jgi:hypothetical protein
MRRTYRALLLSLSLLPGLLNAMPIAGWQETITLYLPSQPIQLVAKLDTGADTSSLHAEDIQILNADTDNAQVRFRLQGVHYQRPLIRISHIKRHQLPPQARPVIVLEWCLNQQRQQSEFTLTDRRQFRTPVLLGRNSLRQRFLVDSATTQQLQPCQ